MASVTKVAVPAAAAGLLLVAGIVASVRAARRPVPAPRAPAVGPAPAPSAEAPPEQRPPRPPSGAVFSLLQALAGLRAAREIPPPPGRLRDPGVLRAQEEEVRRAAGDVVSLLSREPEAWREVLELLPGIEEPPLAARVGGLLVPAVDGAVEPALLDLLRKGPTPSGRRAAVAMLAKRPSLEVLQALLGAAQDDPDAGVRLDAIVEAYRRRVSFPSENAKILIDEAIRRRSVAETDPDVRAQVMRLLPGGTPVPPSPPPSTRQPPPRRSPAEPPR